MTLHWSSAYEGWATGSLDRDVGEMEALVRHLRSQGEWRCARSGEARNPARPADTPGMATIVLMGHSTGSQDVMHYLTSRTPSPWSRFRDVPHLRPFFAGVRDMPSGRAVVEGGILQAPVSDREGYVKAGMTEWVEAGRTAKELVDAGRGKEIMDDWEGRLGVRVTAYRVWSLTAVESVGRCAVLLCPARC